jgi:chromosomal replication initiator protein
MHNEVWNSCLLFIKERIGEKSFNTWFHPITPLKLEDRVLTIQVPSQFFYEWLEEHYVQLLRQAIDQVLGEDGKLEYSVVVDTGNQQNKPYVVNLPANNRSKSKDQRNNNHSVRSPFELRSLDSSSILKSNLSPQYIFDTYIEGDCNRLARSAGIAVAKKPGTTSFNPLMVYGGVGLGKTHLVQAIGNESKNGNPDLFVLYVSSEKFTSQFIEALKSNSVQDFTNFYLQVDLLIIDDIQFLANKEKTQEIFFHIFNHLHQNGKQIVLTSDCPPRDLRGLEERLLSRFKWGLTADLQAPDFETRVAIIQRKMQADGIFIPDDVVEYIAYTIDTNIRELEGVMISLLAHASLNRKEVNLELAKQTLKNIVKEIETEVDIDYIQKTISETFKIELEKLKAKTRKKEVVIARQVAMYFAKEYTNYSLKTIGDHFGGRDHSTVIHAVQCVNDMMDLDSKFKSNVEDLRKKLRVRTL